MLETRRNDRNRMWGKVEQIIAGYTYGGFQEMYQKAVKMAHIMSEIEIENREEDQVKEEFGPKDPILRETETSGGLNLGWNTTKESKPPNRNRENLLVSLMRCVCNIK